MLKRNTQKAVYNLEIEKGKAMAELLKHPLIALLVGALISGLMPWFTRCWQNHPSYVETEHPKTTAY